ncbi:hypothetical protein D3C80_476890 [compost metagenome]
MGFVERFVGRTAGSCFVCRQRLVGKFCDRETVGQLQRGFKTVCQSCTNIRTDDQTVDHDIDIVLIFLVEGRHIGDFIELAVDFHALKALLHQFCEFLLVLALTAADQRREDVKARAFLEVKHAVDHLADRLAFDRQTGGGRIGNTDARKKQTHIVVDFGDSADRRARVARRRLLFDRDRRRQAFDLVDIRLLHHFQKLAGIGRQAFDITALAFRIDRVEGKRGLARSGKAGHHDQRIAGQVEIDALQVMLARAANGNGLEFAHRHAFGEAHLGGFEGPYVVIDPRLSRRNCRNRLRFRLR